MASSTGVYLHDEIGHLLISKNAWAYPELMLDTWGRPLNTMLYMIPARAGLTVARMLSLLIAVLTVIFTTKIASCSGVERTYLIPLLLWFQPWFNGFSYQAITEVPFSLCLVGGIFLWVRGREALAAMVFGFLPLIRHEGIVLSGLFGLYGMFQRKWFCSALVAAPSVVYNVVYFATLNNWPFAIFLDAKPTEHYGHGSWFHFVPRLVYRAGSPVVLLALIGSAASWKYRRRHRYLALYIVYFLTHTVIYRFGLFGSGGYSIFLLPLAPALAIVAALGCETLLNNARLHPEKHSMLSHRMLQAGVVLVIVSALTMGFTSRPVTADEEALAMKEAAMWISHNMPSAKPVISTHVWFVYYFELPWSPSTRWDAPVNLENLPDGSLVVWDRHYSELWGIRLASLADPRNGWQRIAEFRNGVAIVFQKKTTATSAMQPAGD